MQIQQLLSWSAVNWPGTSAATQYAVTQMYPTVGTPALVSINSATLSYDDTVPTVFQVRPASGTLPTLVYGPEVITYVNGFVPCQAYIRQIVRKNLADRSDSAGVTTVWPDDEINSDIYDAIVELNQLFPIEQYTSFPLVSDQEGYPLPENFLYAKTVEYVSADQHMHLYLKEKPWKGGESTVTSYLGWPKLGILISPLAGRFYPGHYTAYNGQLWIDWKPMASGGDAIHMRYLGKRTLPTGDADILELTPEDITLVSLRTQILCWLRVEGADTRLSRWNTERKRDDQPTVRMSSEIQRLYNSMVIDRKERRPVVRRLVRR